MKKTLLSMALFLGAVAVNAQTTQLNVDPSPLSNGILKFYSADYYYFKMDECDFSQEFNVYDANNVLAGTVKADKDNFSGYGGSYSVGAIAWTIAEPGTYTLEIPEGAFIFDDFGGASVPNAATNAEVKVYKPAEFTITTNLTVNDVKYMEDLDGMVLTFEGAEEVVVGSYATVSFTNITPEESYYAGSWASYGGTAEVDGVNVTLYGIESYANEELGTLKCTLDGCQLVQYGLHGWIVDGVDITASIDFYLTDTTTGTGLPIYKADARQILDLQGRAATQDQKGLQVRGGRVMMVK